MLSGNLTAWWKVPRATPEPTPRITRLRLLSYKKRQAAAQKKDESAPTKGEEATCARGERA